MTEETLAHLSQFLEAQDTPLPGNYPLAELGFLIAGRLVQKLNGQITLKSEHGLGTVATVKLPLVSIMPERTTVSPATLATRQWLDAHQDNRQLINLFSGA